MLLAYPWPGNIRELQSVIKQAVLQTTGPIVLKEFLPKSVRSQSESVLTASSKVPSSPGELVKFIDERISSGSQEVYADTLELVERCLLTQVLTRTDGNQSKAAKILGITRASLRHKLRALHISMEHVVNVGQYDDDPETRRGTNWRVGAPRPSGGGLLLTAIPNQRIPQPASVSFERSDR